MCCGTKSLKTCYQISLVLLSFYQLFKLASQAFVVYFHTYASDICCRREHSIKHNCSQQIFSHNADVCGSVTKIFRATPLLRVFILPIIILVLQIKDAILCNSGHFLFYYHEFIKLVTCTCTNLSCTALLNSNFMIISQKKRSIKFRSLPLLVRCSFLIFMLVLLCRIFSFSKEMIGMFFE